MADLLDELGVQPGNCVAVVGAGGKTTLCWRLVQALASRGERVVFTTTTKIWQPAAGVFDVVIVSPQPQLLPILRQAHHPLGVAREEGRKMSGEGEWLTMCIASAIEGEPSNAPVSHATMPAVQTKLIGFAPDVFCEMQTSKVTQPALSLSQGQASLIVEADGARGLLLKAPADYEPAIPPCADVVCVVACLDAIGRRLDERTVHRVERVASITGAAPGSVITASMIVDVLCHPEGGMKQMPANAQRVAVLTQHNTGEQHPDAAFMLAQLGERGCHRAVLCLW